MRSEGRKPGVIGRILDAFSSDRPKARDLDEDALHFLWCGGHSSDFARLRNAHLESSVYEIHAAIERCRPLYQCIVSFASRRSVWPSAALDMPTALERETPGLSYKAYVYAANRIVQCFMTFENWM